MPNAVSDTSVLHYLALAGQFQLLKKQFGTVLIPPAVHGEIGAASDLPVSTHLAEALNAGWLHVQAPRDQRYLELLSATLGRGEAEAIALAAESDSRMLLIDEADGREIARQLRIPLTGTVGILMTAQREGDIPELKPMLDLLITRHRFRLARTIYERITRADFGQ